MKRYVKEVGGSKREKDRWLLSPLKAACRECSPLIWMKKRVNTGKIKIHTHCMIWLSLVKQQGLRPDYLKHLPDNLKVYTQTILDNPRLWNSLGIIRLIVQGIITLWSFLFQDCFIKCPLCLIVTFSILLVSRQKMKKGAMLLILKLVFDFNTGIQTLKYRHPINNG